MRPIRISLKHVDSVGRKEGETMRKGIIGIMLIGMIWMLCGPVVRAAGSDDVRDDLDRLEKKISVLERKVSKMKIHFGGDFRFRYDNVEWKIRPYMQPDMEGNYNPVPAMTFKNSESYTWRLRFKFGAEISDTLHFAGRLNAYRLYGGGEVPVFNGTPESVLTSFNSTRIPTSNIVRVERAYFTYTPKAIPLILTVGRQSATDGPPREVKLDMVRQATPPSLLIDAEIDGLMLGLNLTRMGLPDGSRLRVCYGVGFESGFGAGGNAKGKYVMTPMGSGMITDLEDSKVVGGCLDLVFPIGFTELKLNGGYFKMQDLTDIPSGLTTNFPNFMDNNAQSVTATANLGDMDVYGFCLIHDTDWVTYFLSMGWNKSHPNGKQSAYGFGGLLGNPDGSETGMSYYAGIKVPLRVIPANIGVEYNHGDKHWWSYTSGADDVSNKLATRGDVWEAYVNYDIEKHFKLRAGYVHYDYDYAFSGWHIAPGPIDYFKLDNNPVMPYPFPKEVDNFYVSLTVTI